MKSTLNEFTCAAMATTTSKSLKLYPWYRQENTVYSVVPDIK